jgi:hypothetical protein
VSNLLQDKINEIDRKATQSQLIADLTTDPEIRDYNGRLAEELRLFARQLRLRLPTTVT